MDGHPHFFRACRLSACLLLPLTACGLSGCGGSSTTLAVENTISSPSQAIPMATVNPTRSAAPQIAPATPSEPKVEPPVVETPTMKALQPKLTSVDPDQLIGRWRDSFFGTRTLTLNADGTARMELDLDFAGRLLYGSHLDFDMTWTLEGATVTIDIVEGKPTKSAKSLMDTWGTRYVYLLDCVEDHRVEMRDSDGSMNHKLKRIANDVP